MQTAQAATTRYATDYARKDCLAFCSAVHSTLSPELREMVYEELCPKEPSYKWTPVKEAEVSDWDDFLTFYSGSYFESMDGRDTPHYRDPAFSGLIATEIVQRIYRTSRHTFRIQDLHLVDRFLTADIYELGIVPGNFVQHIEISVFGEEIQEQDAYEKVVAGLERIAGMGNKYARVKIDIHPEAA